MWSLCGNSQKIASNWIKQMCPNKSNSMGQNAISCFGLHRSLWSASSSKIWQLNQLHHQWCHLHAFPKTDKHFSVSYSWFFSALLGLKQEYLSFFSPNWCLPLSITGILVVARSYSKWPFRMIRSPIHAHFDIPHKASSQKWSHPRPATWLVGEGEWVRGNCKVVLCAWAQNDIYIYIYHGLSLKHRYLYFLKLIKLDNTLFGWDSDQPYYKITWPYICCKLTSSNEQPLWLPWTSHDGKRRSVQVLVFNLSHVITEKQTC